ncbi:MAG: PAS domain-containing protein [Planctomycetes bacterium]|nr:PAS domain-containing protein [Planctomycetota bacterium]
MMTETAPSFRSSFDEARGPAGPDWPSVQEANLLRARLKLVLFVRLAIAIFGIIAILIYQQSFLELSYFSPRILAAYVILVFACFVNIFYLLFVRKKTVDLRKLKSVALLQITVDIFLETGLAYFTGGSGSIFVSLYFTSILAANLLVSAQSSLFFASLSSILLAAVTIVYSLSVHLHFSLPLLPESYVVSMAQGFRFILPYLFFFALILHFVAFSAGRLVRELKHERILREEILQNVLNGLIVVDPAGCILFWNNQVSRLLQIPGATAKLRGQPIDKVLAGESYTVLRELLKLERGNQEMKVVTDRGDNLSIEIIVTPLWDETNRERGKIAILNDVSLKKRIDEVVKRSETLQALSAMSVGIAHEVRNPLASIKGAIQELKTELAVDPENKRLINIVMRESDRLNKIISDFLDFAKKRPLLKQKCDLAELLDEVITLLRKREGREKVNIELKAPEHFYGEVDPEQLKQVFINLGLNALEASDPDGRVMFKGYFSYQDEPGQSAGNLDSPDLLGHDRFGLTIEVSDSGKGISPDDIKRIYEPFFTTKPKGVGLGLAVANNIIQGHGGKIFVDSRPGHGSKFSVWLPTARQS